MSGKTCKLKLCGCFAAVLDTKHGKANERFILGVEAGMLDLIPAITPETEPKFFSLVDEVVAASVQGANQVKQSVAAVMKFGLNLE